MLNNTGKVTEENIEGFEIVTEKATELKKKDFFKMLAGAEKGLTLKIERIGNTYISKFKNDKGIRPSGCFIDYTFTKDSKSYEIGIAYNLGKPIAEETFILTSNMNIFKILEVANPDLKKADKIKVTKKFIEDTLEGITFKAEVGTSYNGGFLIEPVELVD